MLRSGKNGSEVCIRIKAADRESFRKGRKHETYLGLFSGALREREGDIAGIIYRREELERYGRIQTAQGEGREKKTEEGPRGPEQGSSQEVSAEERHGPGGAVKAGDDRYHEKPWCGGVRLPKRAEPAMENGREQWYNEVTKKGKT